MPKLQLEKHPLFPSGEWKGFYSYSVAHKHQMKTSLIFKKGVVKGLGVDDIGEFTWKGFYDLQDLDCKLEKRYKSHTVSYLGNVDENGIWGMWTTENDKGNFHLWPEGSNLSEQLKKKKKQKRINAKTLRA